MTLQLYILRQLLFSFAFALAGIGMLVVPSAMVQAVHKLGGVSLLAVLDYLPLVLVDVVPYVLPMAFLLGVVSTFGRLSMDKELIASAMAGIHPARALLPGMVIALSLVAFTNWMVGTVSPDRKFEMRGFLRRAKTEAFRTLSAGRTELDFPNFFLKADSAEGNRKKGVILNVTQEGEESITILARETNLEFGEEYFTMDLLEARVVNEGYELENENPSFRVRFDSLFPPEPVTRDRAKYLTTTQILQRVEDVSLAPERKRQFVYEIHRRRALSVTYLLFLLLGIPTGILLRSGTQLGAFTGAMGYAFLYYVLSFRLGKVLLDWDVLPPVFAAWSTNILFLAVGVALAYRTLWR